MLNALKLNMTGLVSLTSTKRSGVDTALSVIILAILLNVIPISLTVVLYKHHSKLNSIEVR